MDRGRMVDLLRRPDAWVETIRAVGVGAEDRPQIGEPPTLVPALRGVLNRPTDVGVNAPYQGLTRYPSSWSSKKAVMAESATCTPGMS